MDECAGFCEIVLIVYMPIGAALKRIPTGTFVKK